MFFAMAVTAFAATEEELQEEIKKLEAKIKLLEEQNRELQLALNEALLMPPTPIVRRPLIAITEPLLLEIEAGTERNVTFQIQNLSTDAASNVITTANLSGAQGITGVFRDGSNIIPSLGSRAQSTISYRIIVNETVRAGFYTIVFEHVCKNANGEVVESESKISIRVTNSGGDVSLRDIASSVSRVSPGQDFDLTAVIENESSVTIRDVSMTIVSGMSSEGIFLRASTNVVSIPNMIAGRRENVSVGFTASSRAKGGAYPLVLELSYTDGAGERREQEYTFFVSMSSGTTQESAAEVVITSITSPRGSVGVGQEFEMVVTLKNTGLHATQNIRVDAATDAERAVVPRSTSRVLVSQLNPDAERQLTFRFAPTAISASRSYDIGFTVSYDTGLEDASGNSETVVFTQYQGVTVYNPEVDNSSDDPLRISTPRIIVSDYKSDPLIVQAGKEFDLELSFMNTSSNRTIRNIRVTLSVAEEVTTGSERRGSVFTPVGRSSTFFIDAISPRSEVKEHIRFYTLPDAPPRNYIIDVNFEYEDIDNNPFQAKESIGINVKQVTRLDTSEIFMQDFAYAYQPIFMNFELYNTGRVTLSNLMIRIEGNFMSNQSSVFYGSLSPGSMDFYDNMVTPMEPGMQELAIVISYEDDTGEHVEERKIFMLDVIEMSFDGGIDMWPPMDDGWVWDDNIGAWVPASRGINIWLLVGIAAGIVVIAGVTVLVVVRAKKKKKNRIIDDSE